MKLLTLVLVTLLLIKLYRIYIHNRQMKCIHKYRYIGTQGEECVYECDECSHVLIDTDMDISTPVPYDKSWKFTRESFRDAPDWVRYNVGIELISQYGGDVLYIEITSGDEIKTAQLGDYIVMDSLGDLHVGKIVRYNDLSLGPNINVSSY